MKLLKNRKFAGVVAALVCVASMFIGTNKSLAALSSRIEKQFYTGTQAAEGYTQPSIASQIAFCMDQALGLTTVSNNYTDLGDASSRLSTLRNMLYVTLYDTQSISETCRLFPAFTEAFDNLYKVMGTVELKDRDRELADAYEKDFRSAQIFMSQLAESYDTEVSAYNDIIDAFPANIFGMFADAPDSF